MKTTFPFVWVAWHLPDLKRLCHLCNGLSLWLNTVSPPPTICFFFTCFCQFFESEWWHLRLDEHLGRDIKHDVYEEVAPTTHCKTNKKSTLTVPRSLQKGVQKPSVA